MLLGDLYLSTLTVWKVFVFSITKYLFFFFITFFISSNARHRLDFVVDLTFGWTLKQSPKTQIWIWNKQTVSVLISNKYNLIYYNKISISRLWVSFWYSISSVWQNQTFDCISSGDGVGKQCVYILISFVWHSAISTGVEGTDNDQDLVDEEAFQHEWDMKREVIRNHFTYNQIEQNHSSQECFDFS